MEKRRFFLKLLRDDSAEEAMRYEVDEKNIDRLTLEQLLSQILRKHDIKWALDAGVEANDILSVSLKTIEVIKNLENLVRRGADFNTPLALSSVFHDVYSFQNNYYYFNDHGANIDLKVFVEWIGNDLVRLKDSLDFLDRNGVEVDMRKILDSRQSWGAEEFGNWVPFIAYDMISAEEVVKKTVFDLPLEILRRHVRSILVWADANLVAVRMAPCHVIEFYSELLDAGANPNLVLSKINQADAHRINCYTFLLYEETDPDFFFSRFSEPFKKGDSCRRLIMFLGKTKSPERYLPLFDQILEGDNKGEVFDLMVFVRIDPDAIVRRMTPEKIVRNLDRVLEEASFDLVLSKLSPAQIEENKGVINQYRPESE